MHPDSALCIVRLVQGAPQGVFWALQAECPTVTPADLEDLWRPVRDSGFRQGRCGSSTRPAVPATGRGVHRVTPEVPGYQACFPGGSTSSSGTHSRNNPEGQGRLRGHLRTLLGLAGSPAHRTSTLTLKARSGLISQWALLYFYSNREAAERWDSAWHGDVGSPSVLPEPGGGPWRAPRVSCLSLEEVVRPA